MKHTTACVTVRLDIEYPDGMNEQDAIEEVVSNVNYDFMDVPDWCESKIIATEICGITE